MILLLFLIILLVLFIVIALTLAYLYRKPKITIEPIDLNYVKEVNIDLSIREKFYNLSSNYLTFFLSQVLPNITPQDLGLNSPSFDNIIVNYSESFPSYSYNVVNITNLLSSYLKKNKTSNYLKDIFYYQNQIVCQNIITINLYDKVTFNLTAQVLNFKRKGSVDISDSTITIDITTYYDPTVYVPSSYTINKVWINGNITINNFDIFTPVAHYVFTRVLENGKIGDRVANILQKGSNIINAIYQLFKDFSFVPSLLEFLDYLITKLEELKLPNNIEAYLTYIKNNLDNLENLASFFYDLNLYISPNTTNYKGYFIPTSGYPTLSLTPLLYSSLLTEQNNIDKFTNLYRYVDSITCIPFTITFSDSITDKIF